MYTLDLIWVHLALLLIIALTAYRHPLIKHTHTVLWVIDYSCNQQMSHSCFSAFRSKQTDVKRAIGYWALTLSSSIYPNLLFCPPSPVLSSLQLPHLRVTLFNKIPTAIQKQGDSRFPVGCSIHSLHETWPSYSGYSASFQYDISTGATIPVSICTTIQIIMIFTIFKKM